jgi:hypothetical protein
MQTTEQPTKAERAAPPTDFSDILRRMARPDLTNVVPLRRGCAPRAMTPEEALIAWRLGLPEDADPAAAARDALKMLADPRLTPPFRRLRRYLEQAASPERPRRGA